MTQLYFTEADSLNSTLNTVLCERLKKPFIILRTENGKPYIEGEPLFFSLSHSKDKAVIAVSEKPVGVDLELFTNKKHTAVFSRFSMREQSEIISEKDFLKHWTAREAFIKMRGATLAEYFKRLEFHGGNVYLDGDKQSCKIITREYDFGIVTVCEQ